MYRFFRNKILSGFLFIAAVCHPTHAESFQNQSSDDNMAGKQPMAAEKAPTLVETIDINGIPFLIPVSEIKQTPQVHTPAHPSTSARPSTQQDLLDLLSDIEGMAKEEVVPQENVVVSKEVAKAQVPVSPLPENTSVKAGLLNQNDLADLERQITIPKPIESVIASKETVEVQAPVVTSHENTVVSHKSSGQKDLDDLLAGVEGQTLEVPSPLPIEDVVASKETVEVQAPVATLPENTVASHVSSGQKDLDELLAYVEGEPTTAQVVSKQVAETTPAVTQSAENVVASKETVEVQPPVVTSPENAVVSRESSGQKDLDDLLADFEGQTLKVPSPLPVENVVASKETAEVQAPVAALPDNTVASHVPSGQKDLDDLLSDIEGQPAIAQVVSKQVTETTPDLTRSVAKAKTTKESSDELAELLGQPDNSKMELPMAVAETKQPETANIHSSEADEIMALLAKNEQETALARKIASFGESIAHYGRELFNLPGSMALLGMAFGATAALKRGKGRSNSKPALPASKPILPEEKVVTKAEPKHKKEENNPLSQEVRHMMSERIWGLKTIWAIKEERAALAREMAKARRRNDSEKMEEIKKKRQELTARRKIACLRIAGKQMAEIKEKRRLLAKEMTIARRRKDTAAMTSITEQRQILNNKSKGITAYIRNTDYRVCRRTFLKPAVWASIQKHQTELQRSA